MEDFQLKTLFGADISGLTAGIQAALSQLNNFVGQAATAGQQAGQKISDGFRNGNQSLQDNFKQVDDLTSGYKRLGDAISSAGSTLTKYVTVPILGLGAVAIKTAGDMQALEKGFAATYKGSESLGTALDKVKEVAKLPGLGLKEAIAGVTALQATGKFTADQAIKSLSAFGNALATVGKGKAELDRVNLALTQISNTPFLKGGDLNQLRSALPQITDLMQKAFGTTTAEGLKKLGISSQEFIAKITDEADKLPKVTGGINNAFENLGDDGTKSLAKVGDAFNKAFNVEGVLNKIGSAITSLTDKFTSLDPSTQKIIFGLAGAAAVAGPLLVAFGSVVAILPALEAGFATLGVTSLAALAPILPIAAAVAGAAVLIYKNWDELVAYFTSSEVADLFGNLADAAKSAAEAIGEAFSTISANADGNLGDLIRALNPLKFLFEALVVGITSFFNVFAGVIKGVTSLLTGDFTQALAGAKQALSGLIDPLAQAFGFTKKRTDSGLYVLNSQAKEFNAAFPQLAANIKLLNSVKVGPAITTPTTSAPKATVIDPEAEKRLKVLVKAFEDAQNKIKSINYQVKVGDLTELDGAIERVKALQDAVKKVAGLPSGIGSQQLVKLSQQVADAGRALDKLMASPALTGKTAAEITLKLLQPDTKEVDRLYAEYRQQELEIQTKFEIDRDSVAKVQAQAENLKKFAQSALANPANTGDVRVQSAMVNLPDLQFKAENKKNVAEYDKAIQEATTNQRLFGGAFDNTGAKLDATANRLRFLYSELAKKPQLNIADALTNEIDRLTPEFERLRKEAAGQKLGNDIQQAYIGAFEGLGDALGQEIGKVIAGAETGQEALGNLFNAVLRTIGSFLSQLGASLIAYGVAMDAFKKAFTNPYVAIAAGAALIVLGGVIGGLASAGPSSSGGGGGGYTPSVGAGSGSSFSTTKNSTIKFEHTFAPIEYTIEGSTLRALSQVDSTRLINTR